MVTPEPGAGDYPCAFLIDRRYDIILTLLCTFSVLWRSLCAGAIQNSNGVLYMAYREEMKATFFSWYADGATADHSKPIRTLCWQDDGSVVLQHLGEQDRLLTAFIRHFAVAAYAISFGLGALTGISAISAAVHDPARARRQQAICADHVARASADRHVHGKPLLQLCGAAARGSLVLTLPVSLYLFYPHLGEVVFRSWLASGMFYQYSFIPRQRGGARWQYLLMAAAFRRSSVVLIALCGVRRASGRFDALNNAPFSPQAGGARAAWFLRFSHPDYHRRLTPGTALRCGGSRTRAFHRRAPWRCFWFNIMSPGRMIFLMP